MDLSTVSVGGDGARLERLRRWDALCDRLEDAWARGDTPDLRGWVEQVPPDEQPELLKRLLPLDLECRQRRSRTPTAEEFYAALLPQYGREIGRLLHPDASTGDAADTGNGASSPPPAGGATSTIVPAPFDSYATQAPDAPGAADVRVAPLQPQVERFGSFEILGSLGEGGMGVVLKARDTLGRVVALKTIRNAAAGSGEAITRFRQEARHAARLDHEGIVRVFEAGEHAGQHYISHEFIDGQSLRSRIKDAPLAPKDAAGIVRQIAEAVQFAHDRNVVHRDLKPENVLLGKDGKPRVADFGLAKAIDEDSTRTQDGTRLGTPAYMPPEQARGEIDRVGPLSDVYSIGATLYCLVTGRPPFQAANPRLTLEQVIKDEPVAPRLLNPAIDRDLETICLKCLQKEPEKRYASARQLADDLERYGRDFPIKARPVSRLEHARRWIRRNPVMTLVLSGLALSIGFLSLAVYSATLKEQDRVRAENAKLQSDRTRDQFDLQRKDAELKAAKEINARWAAEEEKARAITEASQATKASSFYTRMFLQLDPIRIGHGLADEEPVPVENADAVLGRGIDEVQDFEKDEPLVRAAILDTLGHVCRSRSDYVRAEPLLKEALDLRLQHLPPKNPNHPDLATSHFNYAWLLHDKGDARGARQNYERALEIRERIDPGNDPDRIKQKRLQVATSKAHLAWALADLGPGQQPRAKALFQEVYHTRLELLGAEHRETQLASAYLVAAMSAREIQTQDLLPLLEGKQKAVVPFAIIAYQRIRSLREERDFGSTEPIYENLLQLADQFGPTDHPIKALLHGDRAGMYMERRDLIRARQEMEVAIKLGVRTLGRHPKIPDALQKYAEGLSLFGEYDAAATWLTKAIDIADVATPEKIEGRANFHWDLATARMRDGRVAEAAAGFEEVIDRFFPQLGNVPTERRFWDTTTLANVLLELGRPADAEARLRGLVTLVDQEGDLPRMIGVRVALADHLRNRGLAAEANEVTRDALKRLRDYVAAGPGPGGVTTVLESNAEFIQASAGKDHLTTLVRSAFPTGVELFVCEGSRDLLAVRRSPALFVINGAGSRVVGALDVNGQVAIPEWELKGTLAENQFDWGTDRWVPLQQFLENCRNFDHRGLLERDALALSRLLVRIDDAPAALRILDAMIAGRQAINEPTPFVAEVRWQRARVLSQLGRHDDAVAELESVLEVYRKFLGENHVEYAQVLLDLAGVCLAAGRADDALARARAAVESRWKHHGPEHLLTEEIHRRAGEMLIESGRPELVAAGNDLLTKAETIVDARLPETHSERHRVKRLRARGLLRAGDDAAAEAAARAEIERVDEAKAPFPPTELKLVLAEALLDQRRPAEAEPLLLAAHDALAALHGSHDPRARQTRALLVRLYEASGQPQQAERWRDPPPPAEAEIPGEPRPSGSSEDACCEVRWNRDGSGLQSRRDETNQPRATPWATGAFTQQSPERATHFVSRRHVTTPREEPASSRLGSNDCFALSGPGSFVAAVTQGVALG